MIALATVGLYYLTILACAATAVTATAADLILRDDRTHLRITAVIFATTAGLLFVARRAFTDIIL